MQNKVTLPPKDQIIRGLFFDLDGTLASTVGALINTLNSFFEANGLPTVTEEDTLKNINYGPKELLRRSHPDHPEGEELERLFKEFSVHYMDHCLDTKEPYDGIVELLARLKSRGMPIAVVTNKLHPAAVTLTEMLVGEYVDLIQGQCPELADKPNKEMADYVLSKFHIPPESVIFVGDSWVDVEFARNSGMYFIGAGWGFFGREALLEAGAECVADHPLDILKILKSLK